MMLLRFNRRGHHVAIAGQAPGGSAAHLARATSEEHAKVAMACLDVCWLGVPTIRAIAPQNIELADGVEDMRMARQFPAVFDRALGDDVFSGDIGTPIAPSQVCRYCGYRSDDEGNPLSFLEKEGEVWQVLSGETPPRQLYLTGDAGSGKSTFIRFLFDFYRFYRDPIKVHGLDRIGEVIGSGLVPEDEYCVVQAAVAEASDAEQGMHLVCAGIREQILALHSNLLHENEGAFFHAEYGVEGEPSADLRTRFRTHAVEIRGPGERSLDFCRIALRYLRFHRMPRSERRRIIVVIDDSDLLGTDYVATITRRLEGLVTRPAGTPGSDGTPLTFVFSVRPDTYRIRGYHHTPLTDSSRIELGVADHQSILRRRSTEFVDLMSREGYDLDDEIQTDDHAVYFVPIPFSVVPQIARDIIGSASGLQDSESGTRHAFRQIVRPLAGNSVRKIQAFQRRIATSPSVEERVRARSHVSNYDIVRGLVTGASGTAAGLLESDGVGEWYVSSHPTWGRVLARAFVVFSLGNQRGEEGETRVLQRWGELLGFRDVLDVIGQLARLAYICRPADDGVFRYNRECIQALWKLIIHPAYIDVSAKRVLGISEHVGRGRRSSSAVDLEVDVSHAIRLMEFVTKHEAEWAEWVRKKTGGVRDSKEFRDVADCLQHAGMPRLARSMWVSYMERVRKLSMADNVGKDVREAAVRSVERLGRVEPSGDDLQWYADEFG